MDYNQTIETLNSIEKEMNRSGLADADDHDYAFEAISYCERLTKIIKEIVHELSRRNNK